MAANNHTIFFIKNRFKYADYYSCLRFWLLLFFALYEKNGNTLQESIKHIKQYDLQIYVSNYRKSFNISDWWVKFHESGDEKV